MQNTELTQVFKWLKIVLIVLAVVLGVGALVGLKALRNTSPAYNSITVTGQGEAVGIPDVASFYFSVSADASTVAGAQSQVTTKMDAVLAALKKLGVEEKNIKTTDYSVYPKYTYNQIYCIRAPCPGTEQRQDGYTASHSVTVKLSDTELAGKALQAAGEQGATNLSGISFTIEDPDKLTEEAQEEAIKDAREKAEALAKDLGVKLVRVVSFSNGSGGGTMYAKDALGSVEAQSSNPAPRLPTGENKISLIVSVTYEIR